MIEVTWTKQFKKDVKKIKSQGKNIDELKKVIYALANNIELDPRHHVHKLVNNNAYECHIKPDWLLVYRYENNKLCLILLRTGSHSEILNL